MAHVPFRLARPSAKTKEEAHQVAELSAYNAIGNLFHNVNLSQQFWWHKKAEREHKQGLTVAEAQCRDALCRQEAKEEPEHLSKGRVN